MSARSTRLSIRGVGSVDPVPPQRPHRRSLRDRFLARSEKGHVPLLHLVELTRQFPSADGIAPPSLARARVTHELVALSREW